ncbi:MAG: PqiC family protein [Puniceicoccales bacterium]|jgi:uncharacterized lipoprotein YmbA|nr:PqiC family protein [Puniceicoccales bacterium]
MKAIPINKVSLLAVIVFLGGCASASYSGSHKGRIEQRYYVLSPAATVSPKKAVEPRPKYMLNTEVSLPIYLARKEIVTRLLAQEVGVSSSECWLEPLDESVGSAFRHDLAQHLGVELMAADYVLDRGVRPEDSVSVQVEIIQFDGPVNGEVTLRARWGLSWNYKGGNKFWHTSAGQGEVKVKVADSKGSDYNAYVGAMSQALDALAGLIAQDVRKLVDSKPVAVENQVSK